MATSTTYGARDHARAQEGARTESMPVVPATDWPSPPCEPERLVWAETVAGGGYTHRVLARGTEVRLTDLRGDACAHLLLHHADRPWERLNVADTVKVQWNAYLGAGKLLLSDMGRVLMSIVEDGAGTHDTFCGTSNAATNALKYGEGRNSGAYPNGRDRLLLGSAKHGLQRRDVHPCVNLFKGAKIEAFNHKNSHGWTPLRIADGVHRGMNLRSSPETAAVLRKAMDTAGFSTIVDPEENISGATK